ITQRAPSTSLPPLEPPPAAWASEAPAPPPFVKTSATVRPEASANDPESNRKTSPAAAGNENQATVDGLRLILAMTWSVWVGDSAMTADPGAGVKQHRT